MHTTTDLAHPAGQTILRLPCLLLLLFLSISAFAIKPLPSPCDASPRTEAVSAESLRTLVEEDWIRSVQPALTTQSDAAGACDGVKNGEYGFHVGLQDHPWWQIDLGGETRVGRIVVYNRLDYAPGLHNADTIQILASNDEQQWSMCHDNQGKHFGGISGAPPLEVRFAEPGLPTRFIRITIPSAAPIFFHLDEVEVYAFGDDVTNVAVGKPADQSSLSQWSTAKACGPKVFPTAHHIEQGRRLIDAMCGRGEDTARAAGELDALAERLRSLPEDAPEAQRQELYLAVRWIVRGLVLRDPLLDFERLLFVKRFTQETYPDVCLNHMPWVSKPGGDICVLERAPGGPGLFPMLAELPGGATATLHYLLNNALGPGHVHGLDLWFDGSRVVFGYARAEREAPPEGWLDRTQSYRLRREVEPTHIFELRFADMCVRQLTDGEWSDLDPTYVPNGDIVFVSERCGTSLQCNEYDKDETSCNLYVMGPDGKGIRRMSVNKDGDYLPHCLDNGMIGYTRWEYHERSWAFIQSIWVIRPDGTGADALFKQHFVNPWALEDMRSIPNSAKLVAIAAGHHTLPVGPLVIVNHGVGINEPRGIGIVTPGLLPPEGGMDGVPVPEGGTQDRDGYYGTPWPLSEKSFLVSYTHGNTTTDPTGYGLYYVDVYGNKELLYRDPAISCFIPIPLRARPVPPALPDARDPAVADAVCYVSNIAHGCDGIAPEQIRYLRVAEPIGWPYDNQHGGQRYGEDHRYGGPGAERKNLLNWTPVRILGDVPVQADGSVRFRVPADTAVYFQLLDENRMELRRMRSFVSLQAGESRGCVGCHETRATAPPTPSQRAPLALKKAPAEPVAPPWGVRPVNFLRDVQPVLDRNCAKCHTGLEPAGGLDFSAGLISYDTEVPGYGHNRAYETIIANNLVALSPARMQDASITQPLAYGSHKSKLIAVLKSAPHLERVRLTEEDRLRLCLWIDANAPYHDRFVNKRPEAAAYDLASDAALRESLAQVHARRCAACHAPDKITRLDWIDLTQPERSLFLTAPLARPEEGGRVCAQAVYADERDSDYAFVLDQVKAAVAKAWAYPRRDLMSLNRPGWTFSTVLAEH